MCDVAGAADSQQLRIPLLAAPGVVNGLVRGHLKFESLLAKYELVGGSAAQVNATLCGGGSEETSKAVVVESASPNGASLRFSRPATVAKIKEYFCITFTGRLDWISIAQYCKFGEIEIGSLYRLYCIIEDSSNCF